MLLPKLCQTRSDARRQIQQGGVSVNDVKVTDISATISTKDYNENNAILIKKGKKGYYQIKEK